MQLVLASANPHKAAEIAEILATAGLAIELVPRPVDVPEVVEDGVTLEDNARLKAVALCAATGLPAVADDTGLEVDALGGAPGVWSARYAGEDATYLDNVEKLLRELRDVPVEGRTARFTAVALAHWPDGREVAAIGSVEGHILTEARGEGGFGYDPVFRPVEGDGRTFAEMSADEKHAVSHRGRAFRTLADGLRIVERVERERSGSGANGGVERVERERSGSGANGGVERVERERSGSGANGGVERVERERSADGMEAEQ